ncbi:DUF4349 domain-containing protein [Paenibacillus sp. PK3_47]|uniref:DUF4349 domain-containing protein n=1 Tax=Paenibacillus sp. PK3_47 TaxID=2072642 RepID=UPI00201D8212|nr:DUF4349 domain-containing protein [Paenibacillus sp. PK3_47]
MRKRGLHYLLCMMFLAVILAGCSSADSNSAGYSESAADNASTAYDGAAAQDASAPVEAESAAASTTEALPQGNGGGNGGTSADKAAAGNSAEGAAGFTGNDVAAGLNKKLIYKASLNMEVEDYGAAQTEVRNMVTLASGYIIEFNENMSEYEQGGTFILKVPAAGFSSFLNNLEKVKHTELQRSIQGQDVSEEYVDLESRLKAKQLMESQYIEFMKKATKSADLVEFANQLGAIQEEIEQIKGRMRYIDQNVLFSTVELRLYQTDESMATTQKKEQGPLMQRASDALTGSLNAVSVMFQWLVVFLAGALPVLIIAGIITAIVLLFRKKSKRRDTEYMERIRQANRELNREVITRNAVQPGPDENAASEGNVEEPENREK